jgi:hypothetical protein
LSCVSCLVLSCLFWFLLPDVLFFFPLSVSTIPQRGTRHLTN